VWVGGGDDTGMVVVAYRPAGFVQHDVMPAASCRAAVYAAWASGCVGVQGFCDEKRDIIRTC
jgi:hypothetical protein